jgi:hypothetical protein
LIAGTPSLFGDSRATVYAMRLVSAGVSALFLTLAITSVLWWSRRRTLLVGLALALTPQVLFLGSVVNPSGLEISAALCLWTSASVLLFERAPSPPAGLIGVVAISACTEVLVRGLSPLWVALTFFILLLFAGLNALGSALASRAGTVGLGAVALCVLGALLWLAFAHGLDVQKAHTKPRTMSVPARLFGILERQGWWLRQAIGEFDWEDTPAPLFSYLAWFVAGFSLGVLALIRARLGDRVKLLISILVGLIVPVGIVLSQYSKLNGIVWQGKDGAPLVLGLPILAAAILGRTKVLSSEPWVWRGVFVVLGAAQVVTFASCSLATPTARVSRSTSTGTPCGARPAGQCSSHY